MGNSLLYRMYFSWFTKVVWVQYIPVKRLLSTIIIDNLSFHCRYYGYCYIIIVYIIFLFVGIIK
mgnify:CR=1 FL=1